MKNVLFLLCVFPFVLHAQNEGESNNKFLDGKIGIYFSSFGTNEVFQFESLEGAGSYDNDHFFAIGVNYIHELNNWLDLETGLEYSKHNLISRSAFTGEPGSPPVHMDFKLITVPITVKANFWKYFFANGGLLIDIDVTGNGDYNIDEQTGIGFIMGIGGQYNFKSGLSVYVNPYFKLHTLLPFMPEKYHDRVWESGIRLGVTYSFGKSI